MSLIKAFDFLTITNVFQFFERITLAFIFQFFFFLFTPSFFCNKLNNNLLHLFSIL